VDAFTHTLESPERVLPAYELVHRIRLVSDDAVIEAADRAVTRITAQYFERNQLRTLHAPALRIGCASSATPRDGNWRACGADSLAPRRSCASRANARPAAVVLSRQLQAANDCAVAAAYASTMPIETTSIRISVSRRKR
jgi:hypothetical protein